MRVAWAVLAVVVLLGAGWLGLASDSPEATAPAADVQAAPGPVQDPAPPVSHEEPLPEPVPIPAADPQTLRLLAPDGSPVAGALVYRTDIPLDTRPNSWQAHWEARNATQVITDANGTFAPPTGRGPLHIRAAGYWPASIPADVSVWVLSPQADVLAVAHRGGAAHAPENTLAAIHTAALMGAPWVELDVRMTADRQLVVIHDETLDRTTNGTGNVALAQWNQINGLDAGSWFDATYSDQRVPALVAALRAVKSHGIGVVMELKMERAQANDHRADLPSDALVYERTLEAIRAANLTLEQTVISSFGQASSHTCARVTANTCGWILRRNETALAGPSSMLSGLDVVHVHHKDIHQQLINDLHGACDVLRSAHEGCPRVLAYTVKEELDILRLVQLGIDGITSDDIALLLRVLDAL